MRKLVFVVSVLLGVSSGFVLAGCGVPKKKYDAMVETHEIATEQLKQNCNVVARDNYERGLVAGKYQAIAYFSQTLRDAEPAKLADFVVSLRPLNDGTTTSAAAMNKDIEKIAFAMLGQRVYARTGKK